MKILNRRFCNSTYIQRLYSTSLPKTKKLDNGTKDPFFILCSIGNPSPEYDLTRHSVGHLILKNLQQHFGFSRFQQLPKLTDCHISLSTTKEKPMMLYKSDTYMNISGKPLAKNIMKIRRDLEKKDLEPVLVVLHDELSLPVGRIQVRIRNSSPRGHNGLRSIKEHVGSLNYLNISIGIDKPNNKSDTHDYVLARIPKNELEVYNEDATYKVIDIIESMVLEGKYIFESR